MEWLVTLRLLREMRKMKVPIHLGNNTFIYSPKMKKTEGWTIKLLKQTFNDNSTIIKGLCKSTNIDFRIHNEYVFLGSPHDIVSDIQNTEYQVIIPA